MWDIFCFARFLSQPSYVDPLQFLKYMLPESSGPKFKFISVQIPDFGGLFGWCVANTWRKNFSIDILKLLSMYLKQLKVLVNSIYLY